jgi:hypothetical protein
MTLEEPEQAPQPAPLTDQQTPQTSIPSAQAPKQPRNVLALIALIASIVGLIFACIPGALILGWILLPIAFILAIVSLFMKGRGKGLGIAGLIIAVVGTIIGFVVFFAVAAASFNDAFTDETSIGEVPAQEGEAPADAAALGTRENPAPLSAPISSENWTVLVNSYAADGNAAVAANGFNEAAPAGSHYEVVNYTVTYTGSDSAYGLEVGVDVVTSAGNVINSYDNFVILDDSMGMDEMFNGASATGSVAFVVPDGESVLLRVQPGMLADEVFVKP